MLNIIIQTVETVVILSAVMLDSVMLSVVMLIGIKLNIIAC